MTKSIIFRQREVTKGDKIIVNVYTLDTERHKGVFYGISHSMYPHRERSGWRATRSEVEVYLNMYGHTFDKPDKSYVPKGYSHEVRLYYTG